MCGSSLPSIRETRATTVKKVVGIAGKWASTMAGHHIVGQGRDDGPETVVQIGASGVSFKCLRFRFHGIDPITAVSNWTEKKLHQ